jgi:hypothetical protein
MVYLALFGVGRLLLAGGLQAWGLLFGSAICAILLWMNLARSWESSES